MGGGGGSNWTGSYSGTASVTPGVTANPPLVANAGPDQTVSPGATVHLDGTGSTDAAGNPLTYSWAFVSMPVGGTASLDSASSARPSFVADLAGVYILQLVVSDGLVSSAPREVMISTANSRPVADAGPNQAIGVGQTIQLDGSGSTDADGNALTYRWVLVCVPANSTAALSRASAVNPSFVADQQGTYVVQLVVNDGTEDSFPSTVIITTGNTPPVANAGPELYVSVGSIVTLNGSKSYDPDTEPLSYRWAIISKPLGSAAALSGATTANPTFTADQAGLYVAQLIVNDGSTDSTPATVAITTQNSVPVAVPTASSTVTVQDTVTVSGSSSYDADGDPLTYSWAMLLEPAGSAAAFSDPKSVNPAFVADAEGVYVLQLIVNDGTRNSLPKTVMITAQPITGPVSVNAGPNQTITWPTNTVALQGSATFDGNPNASITTLWTEVSGPSGVSFGNATQPATTATFPSPGVYALRLTGSSSGYTAYADVTITVLSPLVVSAGTNQTIYLPVDEAQLQGSATVPGNPNASITSLWTEVSGPATATFQNATQPVTEVTLPVAGTYVLKLTGTSSGSSASSEVSITVVKNNPPTAHAGPNQTIEFPTNGVTLSGTASDDGEPQGILNIQWSEVSGPTGATVTFSNPSEQYGPGTIGSPINETSMTSATFSAPGVYILQLSASDTQLTGSSTVTVTVLPAGSAPLVTINPNQVTLALPVTSTALNGSVTEGGAPPDVPVTIAWSVVSGPGTVTFSQPGQLVTNATFSALGTYDLRLTVTDPRYPPASADATVTVVGAPKITVTPQTAGPDVVGTTQAIQATVKDANGNPIPNAPVQFTVSGANEPTGPATTVAGIVTDASSNPLGGATITCGSAAGTTASDGSFTISVPSPPSGLVSCFGTDIVNGAALAGTSAAVQPAPGGTTNVGTFQLTVKPPIVQWAQTSVPNLNGKATATVTLPAPPKPGDTLVFMMGWAYSALSPYTLTPPTGLTQQAYWAQDDPVWRQTGVWSRLVQTGDGTSWSFQVDDHGTGFTFFDLIVLEIASGGPLQVWAGPADPNYSGSGPLTTNVITPSGPSLVLGWFTGAVTPATTVSPSPYSIFQQWVYPVRGVLVDASGSQIPSSAITLTSTAQDQEQSAYATVLMPVQPYAQEVRSPGNVRTDAYGNAIFSYVGTITGTDTVEATAQVGGATVQAASTVGWTAPTQPITTTTVLGRFFPNPNNSGAFDVNPSSAPAFQLDFPSIDFNPPSGAVPGNSAIGTNTRPFTDGTTDPNGNFTGTIVAQASNQQAGAGTLSSFEAVFTGNFTVTKPGNYVFNFYSEDGFIFGVGNGAASQGGAEYNVPNNGLTPFEQLPVMGSYNGQPPSSGPAETVTVSFPAAGVYPYEVDYADCCGGPLALTMGLQATGHNVTPGDVLALTLNSPSTRAIGQTAQFTVKAEDASGNILPGVPVGLSVSGANSPPETSLQALTNSQGIATFQYQGVEPGNDLVQAGAAIGGMEALSNQFSITWSSGQNSGPAVSCGPDQTTKLPDATVTLSCTVTDNDGLPVGGAVTQQWSVASGPGPVSFSNPSQPVTQAMFTTAGAYDLRLTASDTQLSNYADVTVTVNPPPQYLPPTVSAGSNQTVQLPNAMVTLNGSATTGCSSSCTFTVAWTPVNPPAPVTFSNPSGLETQATFTVAGTYTLQLTATNPQYTAYAQVTVTVASSTAQNQPPVVNAGPNQTINLPPTIATLNGSATDDGLPAGSTLVIQWSQISGPGAVTLASPNQAVTQATFPAIAGDYILALSANDSQYTTTATTTVTVLASPPPPTAPPLVSAGTDQTVTLASPGVTLNGSVTVNGLPAGSNVTDQWSIASGPSSVSFGTPNQPVTLARFSVGGSYDLRLTAIETSFPPVSSDVTVTVLADQPPQVNAGSDQTIQLPTNTATLDGTASDPYAPYGSQLTTYWTKASGPGTVTFTAPSYSAADDFSPSSNPNGQWTYGWEPSEGGAFTSYSASGTITGLPGWFYANPSTTSSPGYFPLVMYDNAGGGAPFSDSPAFPPDTLLVHPGPNGQYSVVRWTAPAAGTYLVNGQFTGLTNTTNAVAVLLDSLNALASGSINGQGSTVPFEMVETLNAGDTLDFEVGYAAGTAFATSDATGLSVQITQASALTSAGTTSSSATFSAPGTYDLRLIATDGQLFNSSDVHVNVQQTSCVQPPSGMVGWWPGDDTPQDLVNNNSGTPAGGLSYGQGEVGDAFVLNGTDAAVSVPSSAALNVNSLTLDAWVNPGTLSRAMPVLEYSAPNGSIGVHMWLNLNAAVVLTPGAVYANVREPSGTGHIFASAGGVVPLGEWSHLVLVYDQTTGAARIYVNGANVALANFGTITPATSLPLNIGLRPTGAGGQSATYFSGAIDEVEVFNRALSALEISSLYTAGSFGKCKPTQPLAPSVNAGPNQTITLPTSTVTLAGSATSPSGGTPTLAWSEISGPATVSLSNPTALSTTASGFTTAGTYVLSLTATANSLSSSSNTTITVNPQPDQAPAVSLSPAQAQITVPTITSTGAITLSNSVTSTCLGSAGNGMLPNLSSY